MKLIELIILGIFDITEYMMLSNKLVKAKKVQNSKAFKGLMLNLFILLVSILMHWYIDIEGILKNIIVMATFSLGAIYVNFIMLRDSLKNEYEIKQLQIYEDYIPRIDELINEIRVKQHEFDNHIQVLNMIAVTSTDYEDIVNFRENYIKEIEVNRDLEDLIKLDNKILVGFLYSKVKKAKELGIDFWIDIRDYGFKLKKEKDMNVIEIKNKHPYLSVESINKIFNKGYFTKSSSKRGYGLYNIKEIIKKHNGNIEVFNEKIEGENYLVFRILFGTY
ncbi:histidine kinase/DNA gyrase B/HSP90-like ATPase [Keratinibaculum paraultunense]|uniref:Histidine kinase/DNA gyrase B/HSP90-like ATPase n=1 Tax=Keratinibaculum paraultunense TaxID=1278232 RepID=A0A4R3KUW5_9FIRM|nr:ATP-binding protein [Keratinibaculum paraultunense]QQY79620.1 GHKL domain-containing protein [Keratinibaculum paraultunense]TCS87647.1 histidine kinase/DNA gyrase B/HSP90-like ATPase [Keratinibaculum paraultunense]